MRFKVEIITEPASSSQPSQPLNTNINIGNQTSSGATTTTVATPSTSNYPTFKILFTLINGSTKQFHQLCKHICSLISMNSYATSTSSRHMQKQHQQQSRAAAAAAAASSTAAAQSSSTAASTGYTAPPQYQRVMNSANTNSSYQSQVLFAFIILFLENL